MDQKLYSQIKNTKEYKQLVSFGFKDVTSAKKISLGSLELNNGEKRYCITGRSGKVQEQGLAHNSWYGSSLDQLCLAGQMEQEMTTLEDYVTVFKKIIAYVDNRIFKWEKRVLSDKHNTIDYVFENDPLMKATDYYSTLETLYNRLR